MPEAMKKIVAVKPNQNIDGKLVAFSATFSLG